MYKNKIKIVNTKLEKDELTEILKNCFIENLNKTIIFKNPIFKDQILYKNYLLEVSVKSSYTKIDVIGNNFIYSENKTFHEEIKNTNLIINLYHLTDLSLHMIKLIKKLILFCNAEYCFILISEKEYTGHIKDLSEFYQPIKTLPCKVFFNFLIIENKGFRYYKEIDRFKYEKYKLIKFDEDKIIDDTNFNNLDLVDVDME
jgi:hypothetical protein